MGTKTPPPLERKSPFACFDSAGKSTKPCIILAVGILAGPCGSQKHFQPEGWEKAGSSARGVPPSHVCRFPGRLSVALLEIIPLRFEMRRVRKRALAGCCLPPLVTTSVCPPAHSGGRSIPPPALLAAAGSPPCALLHLLARRSPGGRPEGGTRGTQSPSVPAHKGTLVACSPPRPGCASRAPARKRFRMPSSLAGSPPVSPSPEARPGKGPRACRRRPAGPRRDVCSWLFI